MSRKMMKSVKLRVAGLFFIDFKFLWELTLMVTEIRKIPSFLKALITQQKSYYFCPSTENLFCKMLVVTETIQCCQNYVYT